MTPAIAVGTARRPLVQSPRSAAFSLPKGRSLIFSLDGKVAVITGGGSGIGLATARRFHQAGARIVIADLADGQAAADEVDGMFVKADVSKEEDVESLLRKAAERFGPLDIIVNNAGIGDQTGLVADETTDSYLRCFQVNTMGVTYGLKHGPVHMRDGGAIVNTASMAAVMGFPGYGAYAASKWAVIGMTKTAAVELAPRGIRVNCVAPSGVDTPMMTGDDEERAFIETFQPIARLATPDEVAAGIQFLAADDCAYLSGHVLALDGAFMAGPSLRAIELAVTTWQAQQTGAASSR